MTNSPAPRSLHTVLFVEDEELLRELATTLLSGENYRIITARDGEEALEIFSDRDHAIDLVICDLNMPRMDGREVVARMKKIQPRLRTMIASGSIDAEMRAEIFASGVTDTIQKPYDFREMMAKIHALFAAESAPERAGV